MSLSFRERLKLRWKRKRLLWRAFRSRHALARYNVQTKKIFEEQILCFAVLRNEAERLPHFLEYHRNLGVGHFLIVVNASTDDSLPILEAQPDVSVWTTSAGYKAARFGMNWTNWLLRKYGTGKWCLTLDADELLVYPHMEIQTVAKLSEELDARGEDAFGALMIDLYPKGPLGSQKFQVGQNPLDTLPYFDPHPHRMQRQQPMNNLWVQGGVRDRVFFSDQPARAPTLNKIPLVKWRRSYVYVNSTHSMLPRKLN
ncbi:MAG: glycosyltransferase family 2 protein, partial [Pseudomonadota bacterium]